MKPGDPRELASALESLLSDPGRAAEMGAAGAARVRSLFTPERYLDAVEVAYRQAAQRWIAT